MMECEILNIFCFCFAWLKHKHVNGSYVRSTSIEIVVSQHVYDPY